MQARLLLECQAMLVSLLRMGSIVLGVLCLSDTIKLALDLGVDQSFLLPAVPCSGHQARPAPADHCATQKHADTTSSTCLAPDLSPIAPEHLAEIPTPHSKAMLSEIGKAPAWAPGLQTWSDYITGDLIGCQRCL